MESKEKTILILCAGHPLRGDMAFGYRVAKILEKMQLPENVEVIEVGEAASEYPHLIEGKDKLIVVDVFRTKDEPGTIVRFKPEEVPVTVNGVTDVAKYHLMDTLWEVSVSGKCPETIFIGVVSKNAGKINPKITPAIETKIPEVINLILKEITS
jgi:hydrogenase maturation protease